MFGVIMAGGVGSRFWPLSRKKNPKQFLTIFGRRSMIQQTFARLLPLMAKEHIWVVTNEAQRGGLEKQIPALNPKNIIIEPMGKNTAPCIGLAALYLKRIDPEGVMAVLPADHLIEKDEKFRRILSAGEKIAQKSNSLVTIGIQPTRPATGYGYIQYNQKVDEIDRISAYKVKTFAEKPDFETAKSFLESGDFLWNSGIFLWRVSVILKQIEEFLPELYDGLMEIDKALGKSTYDRVIQRVYRQIRSISIDYGVMEKAAEVYVLKGGFGWKDVGSWEEVYKIIKKDKNGNATKGRHILKDTKDCLIYSSNKLVATVGLQDIVVVQTEDATLICPKNRSEDVKDIVDALKRKRMNKYL